MKKQSNNKKTYLLTLLLFLLSNCFGTYAQETKKTDPVKRIVSLNYYNNNNQVQYLILTAITKNSDGIAPQKNKTFKVFIDSNEPDNLIATIKTDNAGKAKAFIPPAMKSKWEALSKHSFLAVADEGTDEEQINEIEIIKSKIKIDTLNEDDVRSITAQVLKLEKDNWVPAADVELKIGVRRLGGILSAGDDPTYSTDSSGRVTVELTKTSLPGDVKGNFILAVKVEDNDELGNLLAEKMVAWGVPEKMNKNFFDQRTLWSTRNRTPFWLLIMAYSIVLAVWGTLIFLIIELLKIKKLGKSV